MKKYYFLIIVALILGLVLTGCSLLSNISQVPATEQSGIAYLTRNGEGPIILYAGQDIPVGTVEVSNDAENLYVTYIINEEGWYLTETHLHVACLESEIPQNKKGNPKPGQFDFKTEHEYFEEITEEPFVISLDDIGCCNPVIAAHAVVCKLGEVQEPTLVSNNETMTAGWTDEDPESDPLNPVMYGGTWVNAVDLFIPNPGWYTENTSSFLGAYWISTYDGLEGPGNENSWRLFKEDFNIPSEAVNISATLHMTADNAVEAYLNGISVGSTTYVYGSQPNPIINPDHYYFKFAKGPYNLALQADSNNTLAFVVRNWTGTADSNPTGLLYRLDYNYQLLECESAWGAGTRFVDPPGNWATYFTYEIQPFLLDKVYVTPFGTAAYTPTPTYSNIDLEDGEDYRLVAIGIYRFANWGEYGIADAAWNYRRAANAPGGVADWYQQASNSLQVWIGGEAVLWQPTVYNSEHIYTLDVTGEGDKLKFTIMDDAYRDNSGSITVEIWWKCSTP